MAYTRLEVKNPVLKNNVHYMTSDYKTRNKKRPTHNGIDMIGKFYAKDYIIAIESGTVSSTGYDSSAGYYVNITHDNGLVSKYFHMKKGSIVVKKGDAVKKGQTLGYMGSTGNSTGAHLHFGIKKGSNYIDPLPYLLGIESFGDNVNVLYQVYDNQKKKWLGIITNYNNTNSNGYAGIKGHSIGGIKTKLSNGAKITIKSHIKGGSWLSEITKWDDTSNGYSGIKGKPIDAVMIKAEGCKIKYRVHLLKSNRWLSWISGYDANNSKTGYAGIIGQEIDAIQIDVV